MDDFIKRLRNNDRSAWNQLFRDAFKFSTVSVANNSGTMDDRRAVFSGAMKVLWEKLNDTGFVLSVPPKFYLKGVVEKIWKRWLTMNSKQKQRVKLLGFDSIHFEQENVTQEALIENEQKAEQLLKLMRAYRSFCPDNCAEIKKLEKEGKSKKEISELLDIGIKKLDKQRSRCKCTAILDLFYFEKKKYAEIAEIMGTTEDVIRTQIRRCKDYLKKHFISESQK